MLHKTIEPKHKQNTLYSTTNTVLNSLIEVQ